MSLRQLAQQDNAAILGDESSGFGWPIQITAPDGTVGAFTGFSNDIAQVIDPDTGQAVSGRRASVVIHLADFISQEMDFPRGIADSGSKPWVVSFNDIIGTSHTFKVQESSPDRAIGSTILLLEAYSL